MSPITSLQAETPTEHHFGENGHEEVCKSLDYLDDACPSERIYYMLQTVNNLPSHDPAQKGLANQSQGESQASETQSPPHGPKLVDYDDQDGGTPKKEESGDHAARNLPDLVQGHALERSPEKGQGEGQSNDWQSLLVTISKRYRLHRLSRILKNPIESL